MYSGLVVLNGDSLDRSNSFPRKQLAERRRKSNLSPSSSTDDTLCKWPGNWLLLCKLAPVSWILVETLRLTSVWPLWHASPLHDTFFHLLPAPLHDSMHKNILWVWGKSAAFFSLITIFSFPPPSSCPHAWHKNCLISQSNIMHLNDDLFLGCCEVSLVTSRCNVALRFLISQASKEHFCSPLFNLYLSYNFTISYLYFSCIPHSRFTLFQCSFATSFLLHHLYLLPCLPVLWFTAWKGEPKVLPCNISAALCNEVVMIRTTADISLLA